MERAAGGLVQCQCCQGASRMKSELFGRARTVVLRRGAAHELRPDAHVVQPRGVSNPARNEIKKPLQVMKFGGTSVADAACIRNVAQIVRSAAVANSVVVVVSAMSGVTNKLVEAGARSEADEGAAVAAILEGLRKQHFAAVDALVQPGERRDQLTRHLQQLFEHCQRLCQGTLLLRELTPRARDAVWSLGERLSAPMLAAALAESGVSSEAVEATDVVVTDARHGAANPLMDLTRERCDARMRPLIERDIVPVTTGFIGATAEGVLTTLGRGGSDYSATIIGAALRADEVIIWTDVDGVLSADPNHVRGARTIAEMSYREAAELAHFGAKVLHPKTLNALAQCSFPLWVRNTFKPRQLGTKITPEGSAKNDGAKAVTAISDVCMISIGGPGIAKVHEVLGRTFARIADIRTDVLLTSHSSSQNDICLVVSSAHTKQTVESLRHEFAGELGNEEDGYINVDPAVAIVTVVGRDLEGASRIPDRALSALGREKVKTKAIAYGSNGSNISFLVARSDVKTSVAAVHRELLKKTPQVAKRSRRPR
jgi:bifunctional aspartokinase / homoserine dehydrogenase 1